MRRAAPLRGCDFRPDVGAGVLPCIKRVVSLSGGQRGPEEKESSKVFHGSSRSSAGHDDLCPALWFAPTLGEWLNQAAVTLCKPGPGKTT